MSTGLDQKYQSVAECGFKILQACFWYVDDFADGSPSLTAASFLLCFVTFCDSGRDGNNGHLATLT